MNYISIVFSCNYIYIVDCVQMNPSNLDEKFSEKKQKQKRAYFLLLFCVNICFSCCGFTYVCILTAMRMLCWCD
jgi:hypothetical protein